MMHFIAKGGDYVAVVSALDKETASAIVLNLFGHSRLPVPEMDVMEFDPEKEGGLLLKLSHGEVKNVTQQNGPKRS